MTVDLVICGLGAIGERVAALARLTARAHGGRVALVDRDESVRRRFEAPASDAEVFSCLGDALERRPGSVVVLSTASAFETVVPDLRVACAAGAPVLTTCEEAAWPFARHGALAREVDELARAAGVAIVGVGINPGFLLDFLPAVIAAPYPEPELILVERRVDVSTRRRALQTKVGVGLKVAEFRRLAQLGEVGHRGLTESLHLLGAGLGASWDTVETTLEPVVATTDTAGPDGSVIRCGDCLGVEHRGLAYQAGRVRVRLELRMTYGEAQPVDAVGLLGPPPLPARFEVSGGVPGDEGTARIVLATVPAVLRTEPGLRTVLDLPGGVRARWGLEH
ncbi:MAG: hypothetical protein AB7O52_06500 [Planctomycetota bacterium]